MKTLTKQRTVALGTLAAVGAATLGGASFSPVQADSKTWKKVAIAGAAVTGYGLIKHNGKAQTLGAITTAGAYLKYRSDKKKENKREAARIRWYKQRYGKNWRSHYRPG